MRDGIALTLAGHPTIVLVHDVFEQVARKLARAMGVGELKLYAFPQPTPSRSVDQEAEAGIAVEKIKQLLSA